MIVQEPVQAAIWHCLNNYDYSDAVFLSERLYAEVKTNENLYLLATSYYRSGRKAQAYHSLREQCGSSTQCQLLFSECSYEIQKYDEAQSCILYREDGSIRTLEDIVTDFGDRAAFALLILGKIAAKTEQKPRAIEAWKKALKINPFLFSAFENLCKICKIRNKPNPNSIFQVGNIENMSFCHGHSISNIEKVIITNAPNNSPDEIFTPQQQQIINCTNPSLRTNQRELCTPDESPLANPLHMSGVLPFRTRALRLKLDPAHTESPTFGYFLNSSTDWYNGTPEEFSQPTHQLLTRRTYSQAHLVATNLDSILQNCTPDFSQSSNVPSLKTPPIPLAVQNVPGHKTPPVPLAIQNMPSPKVSPASGPKTPPISLAMQPDQNVRRSSRLFSSHSVKENTKSPTRNKFVTPKSPTRKTKQRIAKSMNKNTNGSDLNTENKTIGRNKPETITSETKAEKSAANQNSASDNCVQQALQLQKESAEGLMALLRDIGKAYVELSSYDCQSAIESLSLLPTNQFNTSWIYCLVGLAYYEMNDYESCLKYFQKAHDQDPQRLDYMDIYSTALWQLQKEVALSALAQDVVNAEKEHPVTWCVMGNCFSLHKEHDTAIKYFERAVQVDPYFPYAYTLLGHEYISTEELDKAMGCFRNAVRLNSMHYNAWFGMGIIYSKQESYNLARMHYGKALAINPQSSVMMCHIGMVEHALNQTDRALATFNRAIANNPKSYLCKFHRASMYFALGRHAEALSELEELKQSVPKESSVYYLMGKVYKKLGETHLALQHFSWATDLDPKGASSQIKEVFDPAMGRNNAEVVESPQSPTPDEYHSESNSGNQAEGLDFAGLPDDSEDSVLE